MSNVKKWSLSTSEIGKAVGSGDGRTLKVWVGKIMPLIPYSTKSKDKVTALNKGFLLNDNKCKPKVSSSITTSNYINVPVSGTVNSDMVSAGTKVNINVDNHSVDQLTIISNV